MVATRESFLCHAAGGLPIPLLRDAQIHGQIPRRLALVCVAYESPFTGTACGPWGGGGATMPSTQLCHHASGKSDRRQER
jgi:hypothetical protein